MIKHRKILSLCIILALFISNIGFIFKYDCCVENAEIVFNVLNEDKCCQEIIVEEVDDCCSVDLEVKESNKSNEHNCNGHCFNRSEYVKLESEQISFKIEHIKHFFTEISKISLEKDNTESIISHQNLADTFPMKCINGKKLLVTIHKIKIPPLSPILS